MSELSITERYEIGMPILSKLFDMKSAEIKEVLKDVLANKIDTEYILSNESTVIKESRNDLPQNIKIWFHDCLSISAFGIQWIPEHGNVKELVTFDKHFVL